MKQICIALFCIGGILAAQSQTNESNLNRELTVEKEYTPSLRDADKLNRLPEVKMPEAPKSQAEYSNYTLDCNIPPYFQAIKAKNYFTDFATSKKRGYLDLGLGTLFNFDGDAGYQILNSSTNRLSVFASRRSSNSTVHYLQADETGKMKINDNLFGTDFLHQWKKLKISANALYVYSGFNDYGYTPASTPPNKDRVNQRFLIHTGMESLNNNNIIFKAKLTYTLFTQKLPFADELFTGKENRVIADVDVLSNQWFGIAASIKSYQYQSREQLQIELFDYDDYTTLSAKPYILLEGNVWDIKLGVSFDLQAGKVKNFLFAPNVHFNWRPVDIFHLYVTATGGIQDNCNYNSRLNNRYIFPAYRIQDSKIPLDATVGLSYTPVANLGLNFFAGNTWIYNEHFLPNMVPFYYDISLYKLGGNIKYDYQGMVDFDVQLLYNHWNILEAKELIFNPSGIAAEAWNKPVFIGKAKVGVNIPHLPLRCDLNYHLETGRKTLNYNAETEQMKNIHDLSLSANYILNPTVSFFAKVNNLLFQKYDIWYAYPAQNCNIMAGASIKF
ncbi:MAG: hypothetical protein LBS25_00260 [Candidatus Symbiothrix sp.]|nr:hypothetical protein [Candidatus Symbiothrix sp.]